MIAPYYSFENSGISDQSNHKRPRPQQGQGWRKGGLSFGTTSKSQQINTLYSFLPFSSIPAYTHCPNETHPSPRG